MRLTQEQLGWEAYLGTSVTNKTQSVRSRLIELGVSNPNSLINEWKKLPEFSRFYNNREQFLIANRTQVSNILDLDQMFDSSDAWKSLFPKECLSKELSIVKWLRSQGLSHPDRFIKRLLLFSPSFAEFYNSREQVLISKSVFQPSLYSSYGESIVQRLHYYGITPTHPIPESYSLGLEYGGICISCSKEFVYHFVKNAENPHAYPTACPFCNKSSSSYERYIVQMLLHAGLFAIPHYLKSVKSSFLQGQELDLFIPNNPSECPPSSNPRTFIYPSGGIAFEINGALAHTSASAPIKISRNKVFIPYSRSYHSNKTSLCLANKIKLYHIWSDYPHSIIESIILSKLRIFDRVYFARKLSLTLVSNAQLKNFYIDHHLLGYVPSSLNFVLMGDSSIIQAVSCNIKGSILEITRNASIKNVQVIGGFSRLFKQILSYIHQHYPHIHQIITYADRDLSPDPYNTVYSRNGFTCLNPHNPQPTLSYYVSRPISRFHKGLYSRRQFQKHKLQKLFPDVYDPKLSEAQILEQVGIYRVYNSGCFKYSYDL